MLFSMSWLPKEQPSSFDSAEISGMYFLDGDFLARALMVEWTKDQKYPLIQFPSGLPFDLWDSLDPNNPTVHLFGIEIPAIPRIHRQWILPSKWATPCIK